MHGCEDGLQPLSGEIFSRTELRNALVEVRQKRGSRLTGLHLGTCLFGMERHAAFLFEKDISVRWIAGYIEEVNWIDSSALDLLFFNELLGRGGGGQGQMIRGVAERLSEIAPGLVRSLGFGVFVRKRGGGIKNLLDRGEENDWDEGW